MIFNQADSTMRFIGYQGRDLIRFAYQIPKARVIGGPSWLDEQTLNITVNLDSPPRADEMPGIVREALHSRLQLKTHFEKRNFPVLALVVAREDRALGLGIRVANRSCFDVQQWIAAGQPADNCRSDVVCRYAVANSTAHGAGRSTRRSPCRSSQRSFAIT
jgi:uncharacterized protein (TIGR03435 family)